ncbi:hypothetical protein V3O24_10500 [Methylobacter sp. Wu8]|uniref:hypothetical protein n=1 Tax=Methylobacter sp. Wu8 TaxID=3118457 RepID=UPI002F33FB1A
MAIIVTGNTSNPKEETSSVREKRLLFIERVFWFLGPAAILSLFIIIKAEQLLQETWRSDNFGFMDAIDNSIRWLFADATGSIFIALLITIFPLLYALIFGKYPLESMRNARLHRTESKPFTIKDGAPNQETTTINQAQSQTSKSPQPKKEIALPSLAQAAVTPLISDTKSIINSDLASNDLLARFASTSRELADGIYNRAGVYLLVGVMVAFSGLIFFYISTSNLSGSNSVTADIKTVHSNIEKDGITLVDTNTALSGRAVDLPNKEPQTNPVDNESTNKQKNTSLDHTDMYLSLASRIGVLLFIETIAFFFLRQYRTAMEEFRYYEAVKRRREEMLFLFKTMENSPTKIDPMELIKIGQFFSSAGKLSKDETTEIIESKKLEKDELAILEKVIDAVKESKKA